MDDLQARLDRAITEARTEVRATITRHTSGADRGHWHALYECEPLDRSLDRYAALVAVRAARGAAREHDLTAEAERLLSGEAG